MGAPISFDNPFNTICYSIAQFCIINQVLLIFIVLTQGVPRKSSRGVNLVRVGGALSLTLRRSGKTRVNHKAKNTSRSGLSARPEKNTHIIQAFGRRLEQNLIEQQAFLLVCTRGDLYLLAPRVVSLCPRGISKAHTQQLILLSLCRRRVWKHTLYKNTDETFCSAAFRDAAAADLHFLPSRIKMSWANCGICICVLIFNPWRRTNMYISSRDLCMQIEHASNGSWESVIAKRFLCSRASHNF